MKRENTIMLIFAVFLSSIASVPIRTQTKSFQVGNTDEDIRVVIHGPSFFEERPNHGVQSIEVLRNGETVLMYTSPFFLQAIKKTALVAPKNGDGPYLLTVWTGGGSHNHRLFVFDLSLVPELEGYETIVHYYASAWDIYFFPTEDDVEIFGERTERYPDDVEYLVEGFTCKWKTKRIGRRLGLDCGRPRVVPLEYFYGARQ